MLAHHRGAYGAILGAAYSPWCVCVRARVCVLIAQRGEHFATVSFRRLRAKVVDVLAQVMQGKIEEGRRHLLLDRLAKHLKDI